MTEIITSCIAGMFAVIAAGLSAWISVKLNEVHEMVNHQHDEAIAIIEALRVENVALKIEIADNDSGQH